MRRAPSAAAVSGALGLAAVLALSCRYSPNFSNTQCGASEPRCPSGYVCDDTAAPPVCVSLTGATTGGHGGALSAATGGAGGMIITQAAGGAGGRANGSGGAAGTTMGGAVSSQTYPDGQRGSLAPHWVFEKFGL